MQLSQSKNAFSSMFCFLNDHGLQPHYHIVYLFQTMQSSLASLGNGVDSSYQLLLLPQISVLWLLQLHPAFCLPSYLKKSISYRYFGSREQMCKGKKGKKTGLVTWPLGISFIRASLPISMVQQNILNFLMLATRNSAPAFEYFQTIHLNPRSWTCLCER